MAIRLNTNLNSIQVQSNARRLNEDIQSSTEKLSSGSRIVHASDDAASLSLSEKFKANIRSSNQSMRNANDAISILQSIEGNLSTVSNLTSRMRELSMQASTDTLSNTDKEMADKEFQQLKSEIERITANRDVMSGTTEILQSQIIDRAPASFDFRVGAGSSVNENVIKFRPSQLKMSNADLNLSGLAISTSLGARSSLAELDMTMEKISFSTASLGALQNQLTHSMNVSENTAENGSAANSRVRDLDYANETAKNIKNKIVSEVNTSFLVQANNNPQAFLKLIS